MPAAPLRLPLPSPLAVVALALALAVAPACLDAHKATAPTETPAPAGPTDAPPTEPAPTEPTEPAPTEPTEPAPTEPTEPASALNAICPSRLVAPEEPILAVPGLEAAQLVRADGALVALPIFAGAPPAGLRTPIVTSGHGVVVARAAWGPPSGPGGSGMAAFDLQGELLWRRTFDDKSASVRTIGEDGSVWVDVRTPGVYTDGLTVRIAPGGAESPVTLVEGFIAQGPPDADGAIPGLWRDEVTGAHYPGWLDPDGTVIAAGGPATRGLGVVDGELILWHEGPSEPRLELMTRHGSRSVALGALAAQVVLPALARDGDPGWLLIVDQSQAQWGPTAPDATPDPSRLVRVSLRDLEASFEAVAPPAGLRPHTCYAEQWRVDARGRLLAVLHDAHAAWLLRFDPADGEWTPLGPPLSEVESVQLTVRGETSLLQVHGPNTTYCPRLDWEEPPPGAHLGSGTLIVTGDGAATAIHQAAWSALALSDDGLCAGLWVVAGEDSAVRLVDVPTAEEVSFPFTYWPTWLP